MLKLVAGSSPAFPTDPHDPRIIMADWRGNPVASASRIDEGDWIFAHVDDDHWVFVSGCASFHFRQGSEYVTARAEPFAPRQQILDAYYGAALPMAVQVALGSQALHASAVVVPQAGVLAFCGDSHSGKTTLAYGLSRRGYSIWADDVVAVDASRAEGVWSLRLPFLLNLRAPSATHFGALPETAAARAGEECGEWTSVRLAALYVLERRESDRPSSSRASRLSTAEALTAVLAHAYKFFPQTPADRRRMMQDYLEVAARVPVFRLYVPPGFDALAAFFDEIEETVAEIAGVAR